MQASTEGVLGAAVGTRPDAPTAKSGGRCNWPDDHDAKLTPSEAGSKSYRPNSNYVAVQGEVLSRRHKP
ncbi:unnamed protein product [Symbiodinium sp. CCMP2592]|nr:unnamed protein product [Symbiodinium sp. CCMP2592]